MGDKGRVIAVCISEKKGTQKKEVPSVKLVPDWGIENDAHAGKWHRQVSLLALEKIEAFREKGADVDYGAFGENIVAEGFDFRTLPVGTRFRIGLHNAEGRSVHCRSQRRHCESR